MSDGKVECKLCGTLCDVIPAHLKEAHSEVTLDAYRKQFPEAPLLSQKGQQMLEERRRQKAAAQAVAADTGSTLHMAGTAASNVVKMPQKGEVVKKPLHEVFNLPAAKELMSSGSNYTKPINITTIGPHEQQAMVPEISEDYVYDYDELKNIMIATELNIPSYVWGHKGSGKTELYEQCYARTNRPLIRAQHTRDMEEAHILGQWVVKGSGMEYQLGPLPLAMLNGWGYLADEYDMGQAGVLAVYQPVLEGKSLVIKDAPPEWRFIKPHPMFRFNATGNTNGSGDETGLYAGTMIQNSANYDRFGMVIMKQYLPKRSEIEILVRRCKLEKDDADKLVDFATKVREAFAASKMSDTISPRGLINSARVGVMRGSFRTGLTLAFINKLSKIDREVADGLAQRIFGS